MRRAAAAVSALLLASTAASCSPRSEAASSAAAPALASAPPVASAQTAAPGAAADEWTIRPEGIRGIRIGMTQAEALAALGERWRALGDDPDPASCRLIVFEGDGEGEIGALRFMVEGGRVTRYSVMAAETPSENISRESGEPVPTERGVHIGSTEDEVRQAYGSALQSEGHRYLGPTARYLTVWTRGAPATPEATVSDPNASGIRFVTGDDRRVQEIHAGGPSIQYVEGCS